MADVDLGTEHMRWMGGNRFIVGFIQRALAGPHYECEISMRVLEGDKEVLREEAKAKRPERGNRSRSTPPILSVDCPEGKSDDERMPALRYGTIQDSIPSGPDLHSIPNSRATGWTTLNAPISIFYAGTIPYLADSLLQFPVANKDGTIVVSILPVVSTMTLLAVSADFQSTFRPALIICERPSTERKLESITTIRRWNTIR